MLRTLATGDGEVNHDLEIAGDCWKVTKAGRPRCGIFVLLVRLRVLHLLQKESFAIRDTAMNEHISTLRFR